MLDLDLQKRRALQIVVLRTEVQKGKYGAAHHFDWKRVGLSRAYFKRELVREKVMPTPRAKADLRYLMKPVQPQKVQQDGKHVDSLYYRLRKMQRERIAANASLNITSCDLFANMRYRGVECCMCPRLCPDSHFTENGWALAVSGGHEG